MSPAELDAMEAAARKRLAEFINRSAGQHLRAWRKSCRTGANSANSANREHPRGFARSGVPKG